MKFKRLLAAILGVLMLTSCLSFVAGAEEADADNVIEEIAEEVEAEEESEETVEETENSDEESEEVNEEEALLADETAEKVTITFDRRNAANHTSNKVLYSDTVSTVEVAVGEAIPFPSNPTYVYNTFKGWSDTADGQNGC